MLMGGTDFFLTAGKEDFIGSWSFVSGLAESSTVSSLIARSTLIRYSS